MPPVRKVADDLADQLRDAIAASGKSQYQLAKESGVRQGKISDFLAGSDMRLSNAGKLASALGLVLRKPPRQRA